MSAVLRSVKAFNRWRSGFNPLRGLDMQRAVNLLEDGERGAYADLMWTFRYAEKRHPVLRGAKRQRLGAISRLDWNVKTVAANKLTTPALQKLAEEQAAWLRQAYDRIDNLRAAIRFLALAEFRGFAHLERQTVDGATAKAPSAPSATNHLEPVEQWFWVRDGIYGAWQYNGAAASGTYKGDDVTPERFIVREVEDPIDEIALLLFIRAGLADKDWDAFIEIYGLPRPVIEMPASVPPEKEAEYLDAAEKIADGQSGALPAGAKPHYPTETRGTQPFNERLKYLNEQLVLAATGGKLTMLSDATGIGSGATSAHEETFKAIAQAEALEISELFQTQFDKALLAEKFPGQPVLAYFELAAKEETDPGAIITDAAALAAAGYRIDAAELSEKTGYKISEAPAAPATSPAPVMLPVARTAAPALSNRFTAWIKRLFNREAAAAVAPDKFDAAALADLRAALGEDLKPVLDRLDAALAIEDETARTTELKAILADLPKSLQSGSGLSAATLEKILGTALLNGLTEPQSPVTDHQSPAALKNRAASFAPSAGMKQAAQRALDWRGEFNRGGTEIGVARARDILNGNLSADTVKRMVSYFARHEVDKQAKGFSQGEAGFPSAGRIAWDLWGGDAGETWAKAKLRQIEGDK